MKIHKEILDKIRSPKKKYFISWTNEHLNFYQFQLFDCSYCEVDITKSFVLLKVNHKRWYQPSICGFRIWK